MKNKLITLVVIFSIFSSLGCNKNRQFDNEFKNRSWEKLTLREKIGQTVIWSSKDIEDICNKENLTYKEFFKKYPAGGVFVGAEVIEDKNEGEKQLRDAINKYRNAVSYPILICADMETGGGAAVDRFASFPYLIGIGATQSEEMAYDFAKVSALEANSVGVNWLFTPVADLIQNPFNSIVNTRSISDNPELAIKLLPQIVKGYQENGIMATAKHFPGDGVDFLNQHYQSSTNYLSIKEWKRNHGAVFKTLIDKGVSAIMTGHISFPDYQQNLNNEMLDDNYLPATLSEGLTTKLLKEEMGFKGVVVSDALIMGGFMKWYEKRAYAELQCFKSGTDMLLWPTPEYYEQMEEAVKSGEVSMNRLEDALSRIWALKEKSGLFNENYKFHTITPEEQEYIDKANIEITTKSITLVQNKNKLIPLDSSQIKKILLVNITQDLKDGDFIEELKSEFENYGIEVTVSWGMWITELEKIYKNYDLMVYALHRYPFQPVMGTRGGGIWSSLTFGREKSIVVSFDSPYHYFVFKYTPVYINTHSVTPLTKKIFVKGLFGEIPFEGETPVDLNIANKFWFNKTN